MRICAGRVGTSVGTCDGSRHTAVGSVESPTKSLAYTCGQPTFSTNALVRVNRDIQIINLSKAA